MAIIQSKPKKCDRFGFFFIKFWRNFLNWFVGSLIYSFALCQFSKERQLIKEIKKFQIFYYWSISGSLWWRGTGHMHGMPELFTTHILRFLTRALISHSESEKQKCVCVCACAFACAGERWSKSGFPISYFHTLSLVLSLLSSLHICVCN